MKTPIITIAATLGLLIACACRARSEEYYIPAQALSPGGPESQRLDAVEHRVAATPSADNGPGRFVPQELIQWFLDDLRATVIGLGGNAVGIARLDAGALILRYDHHGGKNWPYDDIYSERPVTHLGEVFLIHDEQYEQDVFLGQMSLFQSDLSLIDNMWSLPLDEQPGLVGNAYRLLATAAFGLKTSAWNWWH